MRPLRCWQGRETEAARRGASPPGKHEQGRTQHHETTPKETPSPKQQKEHGDVPPCPPKEGAGAAPWQFSPLSPSLPYRSQGCAMKMLQHFYMFFFFPVSYPRALTSRPWEISPSPPLAARSEVINSSSRFDLAPSQSGPQMLDAAQGIAGEV